MTCYILKYLKRKGTTTMHSNFFSNWKCSCAREAIARERHASTRRAIIDTSHASTRRAIIDTSHAPFAELSEAVNSLYAVLRSGPKLRTAKYPINFTHTAPLVISFLSDEQVMYYLVTEKIK